MYPVLPEPEQLKIEVSEGLRKRSLELKQHYHGLLASEKPRVSLLAGA